MEIINEQETQEPQAKEAKGPDALVGMTAEVDDQVDKLTRLAPLVEKEVKVEQSHKDAFLNALITGDRYREQFNLFNGRITVTIRCRSTEETQAIFAYLGKMTTLGNLKSEAEYSSILRTLMLIAQVERINDTAYPEMEKPLYHVEHDKFTEPPAWLGQIAVWQSKPEALVTSLGTVVNEFEARYWKMVGAAEDINFWNPGGSTGE